MEEVGQGGLGDISAVPSNVLFRLLTETSCNTPPERVWEEN